jgi:hypothetical protein
MFKHFKRRWSDIGEMLKEMYSEITWLNFLWVLPGAIFFTFFIVFFMQLEDYDEIDKHEDYMDELLKQYKNK